MIHGTYAQIRVAVRVNVHHAHAILKLGLALYACLCGAFGKCPIAVVPVECIRSTVAYEVDVFESVLVEIGHSDACAIVEIEVVDDVLRFVFFQIVPKANSSFSRHLRK
ncbi:MAG: Uncharacterised protein [Cryomorphaceae bacterium]|nr:MAG: Uncharacterised protein [Cryomorphaceae bacterium]